MSKTEIKNGLARKQFQKAISNLKRSGLVPKKLDVRKVKQTKHYTGLVKKYIDVARGSAVLAEIKNTKHIDIYNERGDEIVTHGKKLFIKGQMSVSEKGYINNPYTMRIDKSGNVIRKYKKTTPDNRTVYVTQKELPIRFHNMEQWLNDLSKQNFNLKQNERIIFKMFGNYSRQAFNSFDQAFKKFMTYDAVIQAMNDQMRPDHVSDLVRSVAFEKISGSKATTYNRDRIVDLNMQFSKKSKKRYLKDNIILATNINK